MDANELLIAELQEELEAHIFAAEMIFEEMEPFGSDIMLERIKERDPDILRCEAALKKLGAEV